MLAAAATAEMAATVLLAPMEVLKLRVQTDAAAAARGVLRTFTHIVRQEGLGTFYAGIQPIALRQVPYTVTKLVAYDLVVRVCRRALPISPVALATPSSCMSTMHPRQLCPSPLPRTSPILFLPASSPRLLPALLPAPPFRPSHRSSPTPLAMGP